MTKLKTEEYVAEVMPDGRLSLPEKIAERLNLRFYSKVKVIIKKADDNFILSDKAKRKALAVKKFISDI
jgi:bifunctional DNA-binding transcriptional regulator/antitoxin component of YhaV-PrlF toxin-antitoxin module